MLSKWAVSVVNPPIDPVVTAWVARAKANGGNPSNNSINAVNKFWLALKAGGIDSLMIHVNPIAPDDYATATTPLILGPGGFVQWHDVSGLLAGQQANLSLGLNGDQGRNVGSFYDTGVFPATTSLSTLNGGISIYISVQEPDGTNHCHGGCDDFNMQSFMFKLIYDTQIVAYNPVDPNGYAAADSNASFPSGFDPFAGFISGNVTPTSFIVGMYGKTNGVYSFPTFTNVPINRGGGLTPSGSPPSAHSFGWFDANGNFQEPTAETLSFAAFHQGLTFAQQTTLFNAVQAMRIAFGAGYV